MRYRVASRSFVFCLAAACSLATLPCVRAEAPANPAVDARPLAPDEIKFLRFVEGDRTGARLETSIVTYRNEAGATLRLVGAVHIGEKSYYEGLNDTFRGDDAVLYEMVKPKNVPIPKPNQPSKSGIGKFQHFLKDSLNLDFQLDVVDYSRPNFVHADLDAETFEKMQAERGETIFTLMIRQMMNTMSKGDGAAGLNADDLPGELIAMLCRPDGERQGKLLLARHMGDMEKAAAGLDGPNGSVILSERNKAALKVLAKTLAGGKKHVSIFYGAAHMPSMSETIQKDMGFKPVSVEWRMAWDLSIRADRPSLIETILRDGLKVLDDD